MNDVNILSDQKVLGKKSH